MLRAGPGAALSHETAAELHGLTRKPAQLIYLAVPADRRVEPVPGLVIHRSARIAQARHPCQPPPRTRIEETVLDLADTARIFDDALGWACAACGGRLTTPARIAAAMSRRAQLRYNWSDVTTRPCAVAAEVAAVLTERGWPGPLRPCGPACTLRSSGVRH